MGWGASAGAGDASGSGTEASRDRQPARSMAAAWIAAFGLFPHRLGALEPTQPTLHEAHHGDGVGAAADGGCEILAGLNGQAEAVLGVGVRDNDLHGEEGLGRTSGEEAGDRGHDGFVASGACLGGVGDGRGRVAQRVATTSRAIDGGRFGRDWWCA